MHAAHAAVVSRRLTTQRRQLRRLAPAWHGASANRAGYSYLANVGASTRTSLPPPGAAMAPARVGCVAPVPCHACQAAFEWRIAQRSTLNQKNYAFYNTLPGCAMHRRTYIGRHGSLRVGAISIQLVACAVGRHGVHCTVPASCFARYASFRWWKLQRPCATDRGADVLREIQW